jgi:hypothetical protein
MLLCKNKTVFNVDDHNTFERVQKTDFKMCSVQHCLDKRVMMEPSRTLDKDVTSRPDLEFLLSHLQEFLSRE